MGVSAFMQAGEPIVQPGEKVTRVVKIRNTGQVVDNVLVDVVGDSAPWTTVEPSSLNLFPGDEGQVTVTFAPPKSASVRAGTVPFAVRIVSSEDTAGSVVEEGEIEVAAFTEMAAEIVPRTIRGKRKASTEIAVDNVGNTPVNVQLMLEDPETKIRGSVEPAALSLEPGKATFADVVIRPRKTFFRGASQTLPFQVAVISEGGQAPIYADGVMLQEQILPKWLLRALLILLAAAIALFILYQTLFKSVIQSAAQDAAGQEIAELQQAVEDAQAAADEAKGDAAAANDAVEAATNTDTNGDGEVAGGGDGTGGGDLGGGGGGGGGGLLGDLLALGDPASFRIEALAPAAGAPQVLAAIGQPADRALFITDIVFQNPAGDTGTIEVLRAGTVVLRVGLQNFRDLDYHFVVPLHYQVGEALTIRVDCNNVAPAPVTADCSSAATFSGIVLDPPAA